MSTPESANRTFFWNPTAGRVRLRREHSANNGRSLLRPADLRGIKTFRCDYAEATPLLLYRGSETLERDGVRCMPVDRFLRELVPGRDLPR